MLPLPVDLTFFCLVTILIASLSLSVQNLIATVESGVSAFLIISYTLMIVDKPIGALSGPTSSFDYAEAWILRISEDIRCDKEVK